jgi:hypothetical protein
MTNDETRITNALEVSPFVIRASDLIRHSDFDIQAFRISVVTAAEEP